MPRSIIQGLDTIPKAIQQEFGSLFTEFLPGWSGTGEYNFQPGATTQKATAQLEILMQNGSHPWINNAMKVLFRNQEWLAAENIPGKRTQMLSALINFMSEASSPVGLASNGARTGGYVAFSSASDPHLIARLGYPPNSQQMEVIARQGISWGNISVTAIG